MRATLHTDGPVVEIRSGAAFVDSVSFMVLKRIPWFCVTFVHACLSARIELHYRMHGL